MVPIAPLTCSLPFLPSQVVYAGSVGGATEFFEDLGYIPDSPEVNIADYMLDVVIQSPPEDVDRMVAVFKRCVTSMLERRVRFMIEDEGLRIKVDRGDE